MAKATKLRNQPTPAGREKIFAPPRYRPAYPTDGSERVSLANPTPADIAKSIITLADIYVGMAKNTRRDIAWNRALTKVLEEGAVTKHDLMKGKVGVSERTASDTLATMVDMEYLCRENVSGPKPDKWKRGDKLPATLATETHS